VKHREGVEYHTTYLTVHHGIFQATTVGDRSRLIGVHVCGSDSGKRLRFKGRRGVVGHFVDERWSYGYWYSYWNWKWRWKWNTGEA